MFKKSAAIAVFSGIIIAGAATAQDNEAPVPAIAMMAVISDQNAPTLRFGVVENFSHLAAEHLNNGGLFTELVTVALGQSDENRGFSVDYLGQVDDAAVMAASAQVDVSFPWVMPDCTNLGTLRVAEQNLCTDFVASRPYFQIDMNTYAARGSAFVNITDAQELAGLQVCRPAGQIDFDLVQRGIVTDGSNLTRLDTAGACFQGLIEGRFDVVSVSRKQAMQAFDSMLDVDLVAEIKDLSYPLTLHALAPRLDPAGRVNLAILDQGMRELGASGQWFDIVNAHLLASN